MPRSAPDPITVEVCRHALVGVAEEMGTIMKRAAFSPMIKERNDRSCALFTPDLELVAQAEHLPIHLALLVSTVPAAVRELGVMQPGDISIHNDPYVGGSHLPDFTTIMPIYDGDVLLGYCAVIAHMTDVGGSVPGGLGGNAREIFEEGIRVPPIRLYKGGALDDEVLRLLGANVRIPDLMTGDVVAQAAANMAGSRGVLRLAEKFGRESLLANMEEMLAYTERRTRAAIAELPQGEFEFEDFIDDDGHSDEPVRIRAKVSIRGGTMEVDYEGSSPQREGPVNAAFAVVQSATYFVIRCLIDPTIPTTSGCFRSVSVRAPEASVVNARFPAPVGGGSLETAQRVVDVLLGALAKAIPEAVTAAGMGGHNTVGFGGTWSEHGRPFVITENISGGCGAHAAGDGLTATRCNLMNSPNNPIEVFEREAPIIVERFEVREGSGGEGEYRGGLGIVKEYRLLTDAKVSILSDRRRFAPWGLAGGKHGATSLHLAIRDDDEEVLPSKVTTTLRAGDRLVAMTAGGGGFGPPSQRSAAAIERDGREGFTSSRSGDGNAP
jgi:N-methylhydantoinase B